MIFVMKHSHRVLNATAVALLLCSVTNSGAATVYERLYGEFTSNDHRMAGSSNFHAAATALKDTLREAGLEPHSQTYQTLVPDVRQLELKVDGITVEPFYALNAGMAAMVGFGPLEGHAVWAADGRFSALDGKNLAGAIALLDFDAPRVTIENLMPLGVRAVILTGSGSASQWALTRIEQYGPTPVPLFYIDRTVAEEGGLLPAKGQSIAIKVDFSIKDKQSENILVVLPGTAGREFRLGGEEAVFVSATLDTYGIVPALSPDNRRAANAALLADVLCSIAGQPRDRTIVGVFFGSHFSAQEGARHFYYAVSRRNEEPDSRDSLEWRLERYQAELTAKRNLLNVADRDDIFQMADEHTREYAGEIRTLLVAYVNDINARQRDLRLEISRLEALAHDEGKMLPESQRRIDFLNSEITRLDEGKSVWNMLRQQLTDNHLADDEISREAFFDVRERVRRILLTREAELKKSISNTESSIAIAQALRGKIITGHFDFDFARDDHPWLLDIMGDRSLFTERSIDPGIYLMHFLEIGRVYERLQTDEWGNAPLFRDALTPYYKPFSLSVPVQRSVPTAPGLLLGIAGFQMMTVGDRLDYDGLPVHHAVDLSGLRGQMSAFVSAMGTADEFSLRRPVIHSQMEERLTYSYRRGRDYSGLHVITFSRTSEEIEGNARNAVVAVSPGGHAGPLTGISRAAFTRVNTDGYTFVPMISRARMQEASLSAFGYDNDGAMNRYSRANVPISARRLPLFYGYGGGAFSYGFAPDLLGSELYEARTLDAETDAALKLAYSGNLSGLPAFSGFTSLYSDREGRFKRIGNRGELLLGSTRENPLGDGIPLEWGGMLNLDGVSRGAHDYWLLNESRLAVLRARNIINDPLEQLHADAAEHLERAAISRNEKKYGLARAHEIFATSLENRVYGPLRGITEDLVRAVVVLLLLNIPFAFAMERLLCGFTSIYRQVMGFVMFFIVTFILLYFTHPAFSLAEAPIVIFLAFVIILLGSVTLYIVLSKIKQEIRTIQGLASTVHGVESDSSTAMAAVLIGISGMRNRPLKTFLTAMTVILLTFTILVFASFTAEVGVVETYLGKGQDADRIELNRFSYLDIPEALVESIERIYEDRFNVFRRGGLFMNPTRQEDHGLTPLSPDRVLLNARAGTTASIGAVMGFDPLETEHLAPLADLLPDFTEAAFEYPPLYLPRQIAERLELSVGDSVQLIGHSFSYAGSFSSTVLQNLSTISGTRIVPPDFAATVRNIGKQAGEGAGARELEDVDIGSFAWFSAEQVAFTDVHALQDYYNNVNINFITMYPRDGDIDIDAAGRELASAFQGSVHTRSGEGAKRMFFTRAVEGSGLVDVIVPLLLGGLIIFSSLMGSIVDREREIFTYSALGLSPPSVGALFFAESAVYSVVGGMGGYLLSQVVARILTFMGERGIFTPPDMNFSSLASVMTILIVMAVVMLSTIYPALKAGKSANPGVARKWRMPAPQGDRLDFIFPFTVSVTDFSGILSYIKEHFENHGDATLGNFAARDVRLFAQKLPSGKTSLGIEADISLAPFDLGIFQHFRMYSKEFEIPGIDEVVVELERLGGAPPSWVRGNRDFAAELRQQFLLWRSLPIDTVEHYRRQTREQLGSMLDNA